MSKLNCFGIIEINSSDFNLELLDLSFTDTNNTEGIIEYIKNVIGIDTFTLHFSPLDYDHFKQLCNEVFDD